MNGQFYITNKNWLGKKLIEKNKAEEKNMEKQYYKTTQDLDEWWINSGTKENLLCVWIRTLVDRWVIATLQYGYKKTFKEYIEEYFDNFFEPCSRSYAKKHNYVTDMQALATIAYECGGIGIGKYGGKMEKSNYLAEYIRRIDEDDWGGNKIKGR